MSAREAILEGVLAAQRLHRSSSEGASPSASSTQTLAQPRGASPKGTRAALAISSAYLWSGPPRDDRPRGDPMIVGSFHRTFSPT
jgi:hypothetical protein